MPMGGNEGQCSNTCKIGMPGPAGFEIISNCTNSRNLLVCQAKMVQVFLLKLEQFCGVLSLRVNFKTGKMVKRELMVNMHPIWMNHMANPKLSLASNVCRVHQVFLLV